jgi:hypothetical protein
MPGSSPARRCGGSPCRLAAELEALLPGRKAALEAERRDGLSPERRAALDVPPAERSEEQQRLAAEAEAALAVDWATVARDAPADLRPRAKEMAAQLKQAEETATIIGRYRGIVNFQFWRAVCEAEVTEPALRARERTWQAEQDFAAARLQPAKAGFEAAFRDWRELLDGSQTLREDQIIAGDVAAIVDRYRKLLEQLDEPFPSPFVLDDILARARPGE